MLIHLLDGLSEQPLLDFSQINSELALFDPKLAEKPQIVAFNKMDLPEVKERWPQVEAELEQLGQEAHAISALAGTRVREILFRAHELLDQAPEPSEPVEPEEMPVYRPESDPRDFKISRTTKGYRISGEAIERAAAMTYWEYDQSVRRFQKILETLGVEESLRRVGVQPGDSVFIGEYELEWEE